MITLYTNLFLTKIKGFKIELIAVAFSMRVVSIPHLVVALRIPKVQISCSLSTAKLLNTSANRKRHLLLSKVRGTKIYLDSGYGYSSVTTYTHMRNAAVIEMGLRRDLTFPGNYR